VEAEVKTIISYHDDLVESLRGDEEAQVEYIKANFEENGDLPSAILAAIRTVAEARGFKNFAESADLNRENLYRVLSEGGNPRLDTFFKILDALGLRLSVEPKAKAS
jgi:probable addiction module antidote protein